MNDYRERLESAGLMPEFNHARQTRDWQMMRGVLERADFKLHEIEPIIRAGGNIGPALTESEKRKYFWSVVVTGRVATAVVSGTLLGGAFVYASSGLEGGGRSGKSAGRVLMSDYRTPWEAYYRPFVIGFALGAIGALVTGTLVHDPLSKKD